MVTSLIFQSGLSSPDGFVAADKRLFMGYCLFLSINAVMEVRSEPRIFSRGEGPGKKFPCSCFNVPVSGLRMKETGQIVVIRIMNEECIFSMKNLTNYTYELKHFYEHCPEVTK